MLRAAERYASGRARARDGPGSLIECGLGGVPERSNGAVLKTAARVKPGRGFESHPRRSARRNA